tara:strand:+ start:529 stop:822 length:294 start_codon:yes stop_codon:yes gene_type:complete
MTKKIKPFQKGDLVLYFDPFDNYKKYPAVIKKMKRTRAEIKVQVKMLTWETWDVPCEDLKHTNSFKVSKGVEAMDKLWLVPPAVIWKKDEQRRKQHD